MGVIAAFTMIFIVLAIVICVFMIVVASILIHGARMERPDFLMPWIVVEIFALFFVLIQIFYAFATSQWSSAFFDIVYFALHLYFIIVVLSFRKQLQAQAEL